MNSWEQKESEVNWIALNDDEALKKAKEYESFHSDSYGDGKAIRETIRIIEWHPQISESLKKQLISIVSDVGYWQEWGAPTERVRKNADIKDNVELQRAIDTINTYMFIGSMYLEKWYYLHIVKSKYNYHSSENSTVFLAFRYTND